MNPEDQNLTTNPAAPAGPAPDPTAGTTPAPDSAPTPTTTPTTIATPDPDAPTTDSTSSAPSLDLTSTTTDSAPAAPGLDLASPAADITADTAPADTAQPIYSEPLQPAAPVPGSIGSVTSVPPTETPAFSGHSADNTFAAAAAAEPAATPFNPFAQSAPDTSSPDASAPLASSPDATNPFAPSSTPEPAPVASASAGLGSTFQPAASDQLTHAGRRHSSGPKNPTLLLAVAAGFFFIAAVVFAILFINALNNKEVVYYPEVVEPEPEVSTLSCNQTMDLGYLAPSATPVNGTRSVVATYTDDALTALTVSYQATYANEADANLARTNLESSQSALITAPETSFTAEYNVNGATMLANIQSIEGQLTNDAAETLLFGSVSGNPEAMARPSLSTSLSTAGAVCTVE